MRSGKRRCSASGMCALIVRAARKKRLLRDEHGHAAEWLPISVCKKKCMLLCTLASLNECVSVSTRRETSHIHDAHSARTVPGVLHFCPALWCQCLRELWHSVPSPSQCQVHGRHSRSQASQCLDHRRHSSAQCPGYTRHSSVSEVSAEGIESVKMNCRCIHDTYTST